MSAELDAPKGQADSWASQIWRAREGETPHHRPVTTGDIFRAPISVITRQQNPEKRTFIVLQHPCTMRKDGITTRDGILVAIVSKGSKRDSWPRKMHFNKMVLPELHPPSDASENAKVECWEADFDDLAIADAASLDPSNRIASMDIFGIALTLQRLTHYLTRAAIPIFEFSTSIEGADAEVEIIENWTAIAIDFGVEPTSAASDCLNWLRETDNDKSRQLALDDPGARSRIRREALARARELYSRG